MTCVVDARQVWYLCVWWGDGVWGFERGVVECGIRTVGRVLAWPLIYTAECVCRELTEIERGARLFRSLPPLPPTTPAPFDSRDRHDGPDR